MSGDDEGRSNGIDTGIEKMKAEEVKNEANEFFKRKDYHRAIDLYSKAITLDDACAAYYANRSFAYLKTECCGYALQDASKAIELDRKYIKAYYRRASANMALGKFKLALKDFETVFKVRPKDNDARKKCEECRKIVNRLNFELAIRTEDEPPLSQVIDIDAMKVESDYKGPRLEADGELVSVGFVDELLEHFRDQKKLHKRFVAKILCKAKDIFCEEKSLMDIHLEKSDRLTICGDIHGQLYDLLHIFSLNGRPSEENAYLFNGDFVDRGSFSIECILTLLSYKILYPDKFFLTRGNHETLTMNQMYGFEGETKHKYDQQIFDLFTEVFNWLPLACCINKKILVMHGGLFSEDGVTLDQIKAIDRNHQPPESGLMCDILWSDPQDSNGRSPSKRGVSCHFGPDVTSAFMKQNELDMLIRSHEVKDEGYEVTHSGQCITIFSAPNYCDQMGNKGAFINLSGGDLKPKFTQFEAVPHPKIRPMQYANSFFNTLGLV